MEGHTSEIRIAQSSRPVIFIKPSRAYNRMATMRVEKAVNTAVTTNARLPRDAPLSSSREASV
jgi:hypothetical protein